MLLYDPMLRMITRSTLLCVGLRRGLCVPSEKPAAIRLLAGDPLLGRVGPQVWIISIYWQFVLTVDYQTSKLYFLTLHSALRK